MTVACCILFVGCQQEEVRQPEENVPASLTVSFVSSDNVQSRASQDWADLSGDNIVEDWEKVVDGRMMYRLAVFLLDEDNTIKKYKVLESTDEGFIDEHKKAEVTFNNLNHGKYQLLAVANYGNYTNEITGAFSMDAQSIIGGELLAKTVLSEATSYLCNKTKAYPLTMKKDIELQPGNNTVEGELVRTYARLRIRVRNQSPTAKLTVNSLTFSEYFTRSSVNLFTEGGNASNKPDATSEHAITPFSSKELKPITITAEGTTVSETVIFDGYLLESENPNGYNYTMEVKFTNPENGNNLGSKTESIPISIINQETGMATPITAIHRNDLINILVTANYNEKLGSFEFTVSNWATKEPGVEFN